MAPDKFELEQEEDKEDIEICLNCPLPDYLCFGRGKCYLRKKRVKGQLEDEIHQLIRMGRKNNEIALELSLSTNLICRTILRMYRNGRLTREEWQSTYWKRRNDE